MHTTKDIRKGNKKSPPKKSETRSCYQSICTWFLEWIHRTNQFLYHPPTINKYCSVSFHGDMVYIICTIYTHNIIRSPIYTLYIVYSTPCLYLSINMIGLVLYTRRSYINNYKNIFVSLVLNAKKKCHENGRHHEKPCEKLICTVPIHFAIT
jgi:hypothetical protein